MSERERIELLSRVLAPTPLEGVALGIGDDCAVLVPGTGRLVWSVDVMVDDVHFRRRWLSMRELGYRASMAALSDLAAMGARPLGFTLALAAPPALPLRRVDGLLAGLLIEAAEHACPLVGGNVSAARETSLTLTVVGALRRGRVLTRVGLHEHPRARQHSRDERPDPESECADEEEPAA